MSISINRKLLLSRLNILKSGLSGRSTLPILSHLLFESSDGVLTLTTSDLEMSVTSKIDLGLEDEVIIVAIPFDNFHKIVAESSSEEIVVTYKEENISITINAGKSKFKVNCMPGIEYPKLPIVEGVSGFVVTSSDLKNSLNSVLPTIGTDGKKAIVTGALLSFDGSQVSLVTTDTVRISNKILDVSNAEDYPPQDVVIPGNFLHQLVKVLSSEELVNVKLNSNHVSFDIGDYTLISKTIAGEYPKWQRVVNVTGTSKSQWVVSKETLLPAMRRASITSKESFNKVTFSESDNMLSISSNSQDGSSEEEVDISRRGEEKDYTFCFNIDFLKEAVNVISEPLVVFNISESMKPVIFRGAQWRSEGEDINLIVDESWFVLIQPMQLEAQR